jgi:hypothetical protein
VKHGTVGGPVALEGTAAVELRDQPIMYRLPQAAKVTGLSEDFLRRCDCPKVIIRGTGAKDRRPIIGILANDLLAWLQAQRQS